MTKEYIERNELIENLEMFAPEHLTPLIKNLIEKQPTADVVELSKVKEVIMQYIAEQTVSKYPTVELCKCARMSAEGVIYDLEDAFAVTEKEGMQRYEHRTDVFK